MKELCDQETQLKNILEKLKKIAKNSPHNPNWPTGINCAFDHFLVLNFYGDKWNQILNKVPTNEIEIQKQNLSMRSAPLMIAILNFTNFLPSISFLCSSFVIREILFWFCQKIC